VYFFWEKFLYVCSMKNIFIVFFLLLLGGCNGVRHEYPFQDPKLSFEERAADLVSRLTKEEKIAQLFNNTPAIERFGIPPYDWWNECLHGVARTGYKVTVFPQAIAMAAGWDVNALHAMAGYTATEGRAIYNTATAKGDYRIYYGLTYWTPNINIFRDPRWGRGQETYGEDPFLTASLGEHFVRGLQGDDSRYLKAAACAKHYAVHSGPEQGRASFNANVSNYDLWDTYLPAFKTLVTDAHVAGVMCAYNAVGTQPCCTNDRLLVDVLRNQWHFNGYVTSDCAAIENLYYTHKTHAGAPEASADAVIHGTDVECGDHAYHGLHQALADGLITEAQLDVSLIRLFTVRLRLGMFEPKGKAPFAAIDSTALESPAHKTHALKMARQSMVLLRNENNLLPIKKETLKKIAVVGPNAHDPEVQLGNYNGFSTELSTPLDAIRAAVSENTEIYYSRAIGLVGATPGKFTVIDSLADADLIVYVGGISPRLEGEEMPVNVEGFAGGDRTTIALPKIQTDFLKALHATGKPVVFVMMTGSAIAIPWESQHIPAIINAWYGGEFAGTAVADIIFGNYNPSGRLPVTFYASDADLPPFEDYRMTNRTYKYFKGEPLYPFGYGLSFTTFGYEWAAEPKAAYSSGGIIHCTVKVTNTGHTDGEAVPQVYIKYPQTGQPLPLKELRYFQRLPLAKGKTGKMKIAIPVAQLAKWNAETNGQAVLSGEYTLFVGNHSNDEAVAATFTIN
jgi:beta-glucosidase